MTFGLWDLPADHGNGYRHGLCRKCLGLEEARAVESTPASRSNGFACRALTT